MFLGLFFPPIYYAFDRNFFLPLAAIPQKKTRLIQISYYRMSEIILCMYVCLVPSGPPTDVAVIVTSPTSINVTWNEVDPIDQNGVITMYEVLYTPLQNFEGQLSANTTNVSEQSVLLNYLQEYVNYTITVRAYTQEGPGLSSSEMTVLTFEAGTF